MSAELLEFIIKVAGSRAAAAEVSGVAGSFDKLAASQERAGVAGATAAKKQEAGAAAMGASFKKFGMYGAAALGAVAVEAVNMANKFDTEMLKIRTEGGATTQEFHRMKIAVNDMAKSGASMGQGPVALAQGLYHLESMGLRGSRALKALKLASEEAAISGSKLEDTTTAVGGALFVNIKGTGGLAGVMNVLNGIAGAGNMRFQQLNEALGTGFLAASKLAGLNIQEAGAALGVLTDSGMQASSAAAQLSTAFHFLYSPTSKAKDALASIHLSSAQLSDDLHKPQGLSAALGDLRKHLDGLSTHQRQDILSAILPGGRGRVLLSLMTMLDRLPPKFRQISAASKSSDFGRHVMEQAGNASTKTAVAVAKFQGSMVDLGHQIGPDVNALKNLGLAVGTWLVNAFTNAMKWVDQFTKTVMRFRKSLDNGGIWNGLKQGLDSVVLWIVHRLNGLIQIYNDTVGSIPFGPGKLGKIDTTSLVAGATGQTVAQFNAANQAGAAPTAPAGGNRSLPGHQPRGATGTRSAPGHQVQGAAAYNGPDLNIYVGGKHFGKVTRREIQKAMMAGA